MLTKSLHTITAATNVARYLRDDRRTIYRDAFVLAAFACDILGYNIRGSINDTTVQRIVANCAKLLAERGAKAAALPAWHLTTAPETERTYDGPINSLYCGKAPT
jgi:hypothetical protein